MTPPPPRKAGRHFLQIPGPTNVPDRVLRAIDFPTMDHRGPEFATLGKEVLAGMKRVFKSTKGEVVIYPASGTGAWEAALVNTLSPGDRVLMYETGHFATLWQKMAAKLGLEVDFIAGDWRRGADPEAIEKKLRADTGKRIKAVCAVHNETSTGVASRIGEVRKAIDAAEHPALFMVDTISSLASIDYRHDEWGVDVTVAGSQKGLMLPPGLSFNCVSPKALATAKSARMPKSYWAWDEMIANGKTGYFPYTPATLLLKVFWWATIVYSLFNGLMYGARSALYMDISNPAVAATQFTAYMAMMNLVISYSALWQGKAVVRWGYPVTLAADAAFGLVCLLALPWTLGTPLAKQARAAEAVGKKTLGSISQPYPVD